MNANKISEQFSMPKSTLYRLVDDGKIRAHLQPAKGYHQRRHYLFDPEEVAADIAALPKPKPLAKPKAK